MRHYFTNIATVGFTSLLAVLLMFSMQASATVPLADDLPGVKYYQEGTSGQPQSAPDAYDLDDYVIDNNTDDADLTWLLTPDASGSAPSVDIDTTSGQFALHTVDYGATMGQGVYTNVFQATDGANLSSSMQGMVKISSFMVTEPKLTTDNRLSFDPAKRDYPVFTHVIVGSDPLTTRPLAGFITGDLTGSITGGMTGGMTAGEVLFGPLMASNVDFARIAGEGSVTGAYALNLPGLSAQMMTDSGVIYLTPTGALSCPYLLSIPAWAATEGSYETADNWDGSVIMVAKALGYEIRQNEINAGYYAQGTDEAIKLDTQFENIPAGVPLQLGESTNNHLDAITGGLFIQWVGGLALPDYSIISNDTYEAEVGASVAAANNYVYAHSGNVLRIHHDNSQGDPGTITDYMIGNLLTRPIRDVQPGDIYQVTLNFSTDIDSAQADQFQELALAKLMVQMAPDNTFYASANFRASGGNPPTGAEKTCSLPMDNEWRTLSVEFKVSEVTANIPDIEEVIPQGDPVEEWTFNWIDNFFVNFRTHAPQGTPAFNVYVDNIYVIKKCAHDLNYFDSNGDEGNLGLDPTGLANGNTMLSKNNYWSENFGSPVVEPLAMDFEGVSTMADAGFRSFKGLFGRDIPKVILPDGVESSINSQLNTTMGRLNKTQCLELWLANGTPDTYEVDGFTVATADGGRVFTRDIEIEGLQDVTGDPILDPNGDPIPNNSGEGYYGVSFWVRSDADDIRYIPELKVQLAEVRPTNQQLLCSILLGPTNIPRAGEGWAQYSFVGPFPNLPGLTEGRMAMEECLISLEMLGTQGRRNLLPPTNEFGNTSNHNFANDAFPNSIGTAHVYIDDFAIHKVRNQDMYYNPALFD